MILYEYRCNHCGFTFEEQHNVEDRNSVLAFGCGRCGEFELYRMQGCGGFKLKGHCWSRDNYSRTVGDDPRGHFEKSEDYE